jgi:hypothetical protein
LKNEEREREKKKRERKSIDKASSCMWRLYVPHHHEKNDNIHQMLLKMWYLATGMCYTHHLNDVNTSHLLVLMLQIPSSLYILIKKLKCPEITSQLQTK